MASTTPTLATYIVAPILKLPYVDLKSGIPTQSTAQFLNQLFQFVVASGRIVPCNCTSTGGLYSLTVVSGGPLIKQYSDFDTFAFLAPITSTGTVTASVTNAQGTALGTRNVYKAIGGAAASTNDVTINIPQFLTFSSKLNSGAGGFALR